MNKKVRTLALGGALLTCFVAWFGCARVNRASLKEGAGKHWYKGVTHFHTLWSDGDAAPETAVKWYTDAGYDFVSISDHNILQTGEKWAPISTNKQSRLTPAKVQALRDEFGQDWIVIRQGAEGPEMRLKTLEELQARFARPGFLVIPGEEVTAKMSVHVNAVNIRERIAPAQGGSVVETLRKNLEAIEAHGHAHGVDVLAHINHPNFSGTITAEEIVQVGGERFFEVYNGHGGVRNWGDANRHIVSTDQLWDITLTLRLARQRNTARPMYAVATDDAHNWFYQGAGRSIPGRGWIVVLSKQLKAEALIAAMKRGDFYASSGVAVSQITVTPKSYSVQIAAEPGVTYKTQFIGTPKGTDTRGEPVFDEQGRSVRATRRYSPEVGKVLFETTANPAVYRITGDEMYVRAKVTSSKLKPNPFQEGDREQAWLQPVVVK